ncbi:MAG TPA: addiction module toxin, HicA family [Myxococcota bacterium]|nr:addiction module toxin, HicA family [Myxococcota bacterium]
MESATFRKWLADRGCTFERHERGKGGLGHAVVTVRLGSRRAELPDVGTKLPLPGDVVRKIVDDLGLSYDELPGPKSRV